MSQLEELKRQRKELDKKIKEIENGNVQIGKVRYDGLAVAIKVEKWRGQTRTLWQKVLFGYDERPDIKQQIDDLIDDLKKVRDKIE